MNYPVMWVWNPTSEQLIEVASQLINPPPRYEDWKSDTANCRKIISVSGVSRGAGVVVNPEQIKSSWYTETLYS